MSICMALDTITHLPCYIKWYLSNILKLNLKPVHRITRSYGFRAAKLSAWYPASASLTTSELFFSSRFCKCFCVVRYSFLTFFFRPCSTRWTIAIFSSLASNNPSRDFNWYVSSRSLFTALKKKTKKKLEVRWCEVMLVPLQNHMQIWTYANHPHRSGTCTTTVPQTNNVWHSRIHEYDKPPCASIYRLFANQLRFILPLTVSGSVNTALVKCKEVDQASGNQISHYPAKL